MLPESPVKVTDDQNNNSTIYVDNFGPYTNLSTIKASDFVPSSLYSAYPLTPKLGEGPDGYWVNGTTFSFLQSDHVDSLSSPRSPFPYTRMATMLGATDGSYSLFHQIDALTLAEEVWNPGLSGWTSFNINISP